MTADDHLRLELQWTRRQAKRCSSECQVAGEITLGAPSRDTDDFEAARVANRNIGGDNCHRGGVLGAILGAALGFRSIPDRWIQDLRCRAEIEQESDAFVARFA